MLIKNERSLTSISICQTFLLNRDLQVLFDIQNRLNKLFCRLEMLLGDTKVQEQFHNFIPTNFFWVKCVRFSSIHDRDFRKRPSHFRRFFGLPNVTENARRFPMSFEHFRFKGIVDV